MQSAIWEGGGFLRRRGRGHNCRERGLCAISFGVGLLVAMVLPIGVIMFLSALTMILLGLTWMRK